MIPAWTRSLRFRALVAVAAVVCVPLLWVWSARLVDEPTLWALTTRLRDARAELVAGRDPASVAENRGLRVRTVGPDGAVLDDVDRLDVRRWWSDPLDPLYGPEGPPDPAAGDADLGPLAARPEVIGARSAGEGEHCSLSRRGLMLCAAAARLPDGRVVHVEAASTRPQWSLYEDRFQLTLLLLGAGFLGAVVALWIGQGLVDPIRQLRRQVTDRIAHGSLEPVDLPRPDELGELAASFNQLLTTIRSRNAANEAFAADVAHEIKNPTAAVRAAAEALARGNADPERLARLSRVLDDAGKRIDLVVTRFLELARAEAGLVAEPRQPLDLAALAKGLVSSFEADPRHEATAFSVAGESAVVEGSPERLETAIRNLLSNAAAFSGGAVSVTTGVDGDDAVLTVADRGPGVDPEDLPRVFERYFSRRAGGTGLGLALTRAIVEAHGGAVTAESSPGQGSTFRVRLPRSRAAAA